MAELGQIPSAYGSLGEQVEAEQAARKEEVTQRLEAVREKLRAARAAQRPVGYDPSVRTLEDYQAKKEEAMGLGDPYLISQEEADFNQRAFEDPLGSRFGSFVSGLRTGAGMVESAVDLMDMYQMVGEGKTWEEAQAIKADENEAVRWGEDSLSKFLHIDDLMKMHAMRPDVQQRHSGWNLAGQVSAAVIDPTSLLPLAPFAAGAGLGKTAAIAFGTGAGLGAADSALYQAARNGEVDLGHLALSTGIGAVVGPSLVYGGAAAKSIWKTFLSKADAGVDGSDEAARALVDAVEIPPNQGTPPAAFQFGPQRVPGGVGQPGNIGPNAGPQAPMPANAGTPSRAEMALQRIQKEATDKRNLFLEYLKQGDTVAIAGMLRSLNIPASTERTLAATPYDLLRSTGAQEADYLLRNFGAPNKPAAKAIVEENIDHPANWTEVTPKKAYKLVDGNTVYELSRRGPDKWALVEKKGKKRTKVGEYKKEWAGRQAARARIEKRKGGKVEIPERPTKEQNSAALRGFLRGESGRAGPRGQYGGSSDPAAQTQFLAQVAAGMMGAGAGYSAGGDPGSAIVGAGLALGVMPSFKFIKQMADVDAKLTPRQTDMHVALADTLAKPVHVVRDRAGPSGDEMFQKWKKSQAKTDMLSSNLHSTVTRVPQRLDRLKISDDAKRVHKSQAREILQKRRSRQDATPAAAEMADDWKRALDDTLREAHRAGLLDDKAYAALKKFAAKDGYFPRVPDRLKLHTAEGEKAFIDAITRWIRNPETGVVDTTRAKILVSRIAHEDAESKPFFKNLPAEDATREEVLAFSRKLLGVQQANAFNPQLSAHLEKSRAFKGAEADEILQPFMIDDPVDALTHYIQDTTKRIAYAEQFGPNDEVAKKLLEDIRWSAGEPMQKLAQEIHWQRTGNLNSKQLQAAANQTSWWRETQGRIDSFETLKLSMAAITNAGQVPVNASILHARMTGGNLGKATLKPMMDIAKMIRKPEFKKIAAESGAGIETTILQMIGEHTNMNHMIFGKQMGGPLEYINNPAKFLKAVGFIDIEKFNRSLAANWGVLAAKDLLGEASQLRAAGKPINKRLLRSFKELGLDADVYNGLRKVTDAEMAEAGLRFSDMVNFRNLPGELPMYLSHPNAQLFRKFKSFAYNHGNFLFHNIIRPIFEDNAKGAAGSAAALAALAGTVGVSVDSLKQLMKGDDADYTLTEQWARGLATTGGAGLMWDMLSSTHPLSAIAGPAASDAMVLHREVKSMLQGKDTPYEAFLDLMTGSLVLPKEKELKERLGR